MDTTFDLPLGKRICSELNFILPLILDPLCKMLLDGISLLDSKLHIPLGIPSNFHSLIQYTVLDGDTNPVTNQAPSSDDIVVHDSFYQRNVFRKLFLTPASNYF